MTQLVTAEGPILGAGERQTLPASASAPRGRGPVLERRSFLAASRTLQIAEKASPRRSRNRQNTPRTKNTKKTKNTTVRTPGTASPQRCLRDQGPAQPALFETRRASQTQALSSLACVCVALFVSHPLRGPARARFRVFVDLRVFVVKFLRLCEFSALCG